MFQFSGFAPTHYEFMCRSARKQGFPHSEIFGSKLIRSSPKLIAAYHVLHRLCMPRHPPNALITLNRSHCRCSSSSNPKGCRTSYLLQKVRHDAINVFDLDTLLELRRAVHLCQIIKTSFSRSNPVPRGQATVIRSFVRHRLKRRTTHNPE